MTLLNSTERQEKLHTENSESLEDFKARLLTRLLETKKSVQTYVTNQTSQYTATREAISSVLGTKQEVNDLRPVITIARNSNGYRTE